MRCDILVVGGRSDISLVSAQEYGWVGGNLKSTPEPNLRAAYLLRLLLLLLLLLLRLLLLLLLLILQSQCEV